MHCRCPHNSPNAHTEEELELINRLHKEHGRYGYAEVYVRSLEVGYNRSYGSMCRQLRKQEDKFVKRVKKSYEPYQAVKGKFVGDKVQIDIKYVPQHCIEFPSHGKRYYPITAIDEFSRKRALRIVDEKSTFETGEFLSNLRHLLGFPIKTIQVDNGREFVNNRDITDKLSYFEEVARANGYEVQRIKPYSP